MTQMEVMASIDRRPLPARDDVSSFDRDTAGDRMLVFRDCMPFSSSQQPSGPCYVRPQAVQFALSQVAGPGTRLAGAMVLTAV